MASSSTNGRATIMACLKIQICRCACKTGTVGIVYGFVYIIINCRSNLYYLLMRPPPGVKWNTGLRWPFPCRQNPVARVRQPFPCGGKPVARVRQPFTHGKKPVARVRQPFPCGGKPVARVRQPSARWPKPITDVQRLYKGRGLNTRKFHVRYQYGFTYKNCNQY
jgi:hypothetical protein